MPSILGKGSRAGRTGAGVVIAVLAEDQWPASEDLARWRRLTPSASWVHIGVRRADLGRVGGLVEEMSEERGVRPGQLVLFGAGEIGRAALELVAQGSLECAGILAIDVPCTPLPFHHLETEAVIRLVVHQESEEEPGLIVQLKHADVDERIIRLNQAGSTTPQATGSAAEAFLLELVATVGHRPRLRASK
ncbi:hypothetical protein [Bradyrhizobium vignae]|uniref:Uncharacterized protein n=1 Tax=Bradyrhizobium vignae TaxID=1549949 RepID=A0A2U3PVB1_9BRAD|nr:hypothetical protein [Bradyrhizobium vignae]SPP93064.1 conserved protein of unknown function [Bradyrhizobium vignae]